MIIKLLEDFEESISLANYEVVAFHATSITACKKIEQIGFVPSKIISEVEHEQILCMARYLNLNTFSYTEWLEMRSVTFTKLLEQAVSHVRNGWAGGQGLIQVKRLLDQILDSGEERYALLANELLQKIRNILESESVIYVVDLSGLEERVVDDKKSGFFQFYWDPEKPLPKISEIDPSRLIARLTV